MFKFDLQPNEKVLNIYRQTETVLFKPVIIILVLIYIPWYFLLKYNLVTNYLRLLIFWTVLVFSYGLIKYLIWLLNVYMVTDKRIVIVSYQNIFNKTVSEMPLKSLLNAGFEVKGFWQSILSYGNVEIRAQGLPHPLIFKNVSQPAVIKDFLWSLHGQSTQ